MAQYLITTDDYSSGRIYAWKTTSDPTTLANWSAQDHPVRVRKGRVRSLWAVQDGTTIHVVSMSDEADVEYSSFSTSTDAWVIENEFVVNASGRRDERLGVSIGVRSDGDVIVLYSANDASLGTRYARRESGSWTSEIAVDTTSFPVAGSVVIGASDRMHFFFLRDAVSDLMHRSLSSANALDTVATIDAGVEVSTDHAARGISYVDNGNTVVKQAYRDVDQSIAVARFNSQANPSISTDVPASDNDVSTAGNVTPAMCLAVDGTDTWMLYSGGGVAGTDRDVYSDMQEDGGSWGTDTEEQDAVGANNMNSAGVYTRSGTKLGYVWLDLSTITFDEIALVTPLDPIPDRLYKVEQAINRSGTY